MAPSEETIELSPAQSPAAAFGKFLTRLGLVAGAALALGYYLPLFRAHERLLREFDGVVRERDTLSASLGEARASLAASEKVVAGLRGELDGAAAHVAAGQDALARARAAVEARLAHRVKKGLVAVRADAGSVVVSIADAVAARAPLPAPALAARLGLCETEAALAAALPGRPMVFTVRPTDAAEPFAERAARAGRIVDALASACHGVPNALSAVVRNDVAAPETALELSAAP